MGILSNLAGKAITRGTRSGLKGSGRTAPLRTLDEMPTSEATLKRREEGRTLFGTSRQRMEEPPLATDEIKQPVDTPTITTTPPPVDEAKTARMIMLQGADEPIEAAPPITPIETPPIRAEGERIMESAGAAKLYPTYDKYLSDIKELGFSLKDLKSTNLPTNEKQFLIDRERAIQEYVEAPAQGTVRRILSEGGEPYSSNAFGPQAKGVWYKNLKGVDTFEELDTPPVRAEVDELVPSAIPDSSPFRISSLKIPTGFELKRDEYKNFTGALKESLKKDALDAESLYDLFYKAEDAVEVLHEARGAPNRGTTLGELKSAKKQLYKAGQDYLKLGADLEELPEKIYVYRYGNLFGEAPVPFTTNPKFSGYGTFNKIRSRRTGEEIPLIKYEVNSKDILAVPNSIREFKRTRSGVWEENEVIIAGNKVKEVKEDIDGVPPVKAEMDALMPSQAITSEKTSRKQVSAIFKNKLFDEPSGSRNLDIGGGKYNLGSDWLKENKGISNFVFDPYNRSKKHNAAVLKEFETELADSVTAANVLNVIKEKLSRAKVIEDSFKYLKDGKKAYFQIHEGHGKEAGSGIGRETRDGWQNYKKTTEYIKEIEEIYGKGNVEKKGNTLITKKPSTKEVKPKKGKTREEVELQGGPLSTKLNEQKIGRILDEHNIEWEYNDNGGITAIEEFSKGPSRKKYFKSNTSLKTIRNWLGYAKGGVVDMRNGGGVGAVGEAAALMASGGQASSMENGGDVDPAYSLYEDEKLMRPTTSIRGKSGEWKTRVSPHPWERGPRETWAKQRKHHMSQAKKHYKEFKNWSVFAKKMGQVPPTAYVLPFDEARAFSPVLMSGERFYKGRRVQHDIPFRTSESTMTDAEFAEFQNKGTTKLWKTRRAKEAKELFRDERSISNYGPDFGAVGVQEKSSGISGADTYYRTGRKKYKPIIGFLGEGSDPSIPTFAKEAESKIMSGSEFMNPRQKTSESTTLNKALQGKPDIYAGESIPIGQESWRTEWEKRDLQDWSTTSETVKYAGKRGGVVDMRNGGRVKMQEGGTLKSRAEARKGFSAETEEARKHRTETGLRREVSLLPTNARIFVESALLGEKSPISEEDFTKDELDALKKLILVSQQWHRGPEVIDDARKIYGLGPTTAENTSQANASREWLTPSKKGVVDYSAYQKTDDMGSRGFGFENTISPMGRVKTTLGQFGYKKLPSGDVSVGDEYDFSKYYADEVSTGAKILEGIISLGYAPLRQYASEVIPEGSGRKVRITIPREQFTDKEYKSLFEDYEGSSELEVSKSKGGVVDMRNGGRVGAAVVAASLMASGGQAISNQMDQLMSEGGEIQHMKGLPLDIFNRHFTRLVKSGLANPEYRQQALQNFDKFTDEVFKIESSKNWKAKNRLGYKGGFQFGKPDMDMTLNRLQRNYKDKWIEDARIHGDASQLTPEQQTALFVTNLFDKTLKDSKGNKLTGEGDRILSGVLKDDKGSMIEAYERLHYADTDKLDLPTRFRTNVVFRFGDDWENRIFGWAKKAKDIKNKYLN